MPSFCDACDGEIRTAYVKTNRATLTSLRAQRVEQEAERDFARVQAERQRRLVRLGSTSAETPEAAEW